MRSSTGQTTEDRVPRGCVKKKVKGNLIRWTCLLIRHDVSSVTESGSLCFYTVWVKQEFLRVQISTSLLSMYLYLSLLSAHFLPFLCVVSVFFCHVEPHSGPCRRVFSIRIRNFPFTFCDPSGGRFPNRGEGGTGEVTDVQSCGWSFTGVRDSMSTLFEEGD